MGMQWNNETMPFRMSSIAKSGRASYKEDTMRSETGEQCKKLWIGMMRDTIAKKVQKMTRIALVLPCHSRLDDDCFFWEIINTCLVLIVNNQNTRKLQYSNWKFVCLNSYFYLLPYVYLHCMQRICFCALIVFVFALYLNGGAGESWNSRLGSLRLSSQRNPRLSFVTKVRDGKKHWWRRLLFYYFSLWLC